MFPEGGSTCPALNASFPPCVLLMLNATTPSCWGPALALAAPLICVIMIQYRQSSL